MAGVQACTEDSAACLVGADCPSGECGSDGTCTPPEEGSTGEDGSSSEGTGETSETTSGSVTSESGSGSGSEETGEPSSNCMPPNGDTLIEQTELFFNPGLQANYLAAQDVTFNSAGAVIDGERVWDLSIEFAGDHTTSGEYLAIEGQWFEPSFPGASYAARLTDADDLLGVFEVSDSALTLRGVVSPGDGLTRTELVYDPPATILTFPLFEGQTWESESTVSGLALGVGAFYTERYENSITSSGVVLTPFGEYQALRIGVVLTRTIGAFPTVLRTFSFVSECVGTIATVRSTDNEMAEEFTQLSEVRRLDP